jgi:hypothetical protein
MIASTPRSNLRIAAATALLSLSSLAFAQTQPAPAAPAAPVPPVAAPTCESPGDLPTTVKPGMNTVDGFQKKVDNYGNCMKAYVAEHRTAAETAVATARAHQDAANEAVSKYNNYVNALNEQQAKLNK